MRLSVVIVNYRSWPDVDRLASSLIHPRSESSGPWEVLVVDNASNQDIPPGFLDPRPGLRTILRPENDGFSAGVNAGWRASTSPWVLVLNPDVVVEDGLIDRVLGRLDAYEARVGRVPGVVGFGLRNQDGSAQPSVGDFPSLARSAWEQLIPRSRRKYQPERRHRPGPVDWVTGACMLLNAGLLEELGGMDEDFFLYHEDVALCRSARQRGWAVLFDPEVSVVHLHPLQNRPISPKMRLFTRHGKLLYFRKHLPGWQFVALTAVVRAEARLRAASCRVRGRAGEARAWEAVNRVARLLGSGRDLRGRDVRIMAEALDEAEESARPSPRVTSPEAAGGTHRTPRGTRSNSPRKDGP